MIESSAHGDEYDGVIFSQLVWLYTLSTFAIFKVYIFFFGTLYLNALFSANIESNRSCWIWELKNWNYWSKEEGRIVHKQKSFDTRNGKLLIGSVMNKIDVRDPLNHNSTIFGDPSYLFMLLVSLYSCSKSYCSCFSCFNLVYIWL